MKKCLLVLCAFLCLSVSAHAASQDAYTLPEPYLGWEKSYLKAFPELQAVMDAMIATSKGFQKDATQEVLHNRVCSALAYHMAKEAGQPVAVQRLTAAGDLLHNISKEDPKAVLTSPEVFAKVEAMVAALKKAGKLAHAPEFFGDAAVLRDPKVGNNRGLIHHLTGAVTTGEILQKNGFSAEDILALQSAVIEHSTGYWYFRDSVDQAAGKAGAWKHVYPAPSTPLSKYIHDADLISQFVPESVTPEGSKWRELAKKRWKAVTTKDEGHVVYYVFSRLFDEAKTPEGAAMAKEKWLQITPALNALMGLDAKDDAIAKLGVPAVFKK